MATREDIDRDLLELAQSLQAIVAAGRLLDERLDAIEARLDWLEQKPRRAKLVSTN